ncbi:MAG TPA: PEGA domain-containing protein [Gemmataceae bacterium]|nr:PEGA domain-containing protein [Gemmataceae bacterium]
MSRKLPFLTGTVALAFAALATSGCVDRRFVIESDPPGAVVYMNDKRIGVTPMDQQFIYSGKYRFEFVRDGYETVVVDEQVRSPWYEWFPIEFVAENLWPWTIHEKVYIPTKPMALPPMQVIPPEVIFQRAQQLQAQGQTLVDPNAPIIGPPPPGAVIPDTNPIGPQQLPPAPANPNPALTPVPIRQ